MSCKNTLLSCVSAIALSLAMTQSALAVPVEETATAPAAEAPAPVAAEQAAAAAEPAVEATSAAAAPPPPTIPPMPSHMPPPEIPPEILERLEQHRKEMAMSPEERWEVRRTELNRRYEALRARATEAGMQFPEAAPWDQEPEWLSYDQMRQQMQGRGVELPEQPAWPGGMGMSDEERQAHQDAMQEKMDAMRKEREKMAAMSVEERDALREQRYQEMRERAASHGMDLPETPPWKQPPEMGFESAPFPAMPKPPAMPEPPAMPAGKDLGGYQDIIAGMSPEEREACMAMHRMHMQQRMQRPPQPMAPPRGYGPGYGYGQGRGYGQGPGYGPGYGYGPGRGFGPRWGGPQGYPE